MNELHKRGYVRLDITDKRVLRKVRPDVVFHCVAWTAVDLAEDENKQEKVHAINTLGTSYIQKHAGYVTVK